jgi:hypothetical protein
MTTFRIPTLAALALVLASASGMSATPAQAGQTTAFLMPADRARATFEDERVKMFLAVAAREFGGVCAAPDTAKTEATATQRGGGDFSSAFYQIDIPCPGRNGLAAVQITAEFSPPRGQPLDLVLSLRFRQ